MMMSDNNKMLRVGCLGLGVMGAPMARRLAQHGCLSQIWNRTSQVAEQLAKELNLTAAPTAVDVVADVEVAFICVSKDDDVISIVNSVLSAIKPGTILIDMSTISQNTAIHVASLIEKQGGEFLDIPVTGGVEGAQTGRLAMMVGGHLDTLEKVNPLLEILGSRIVHMGGHGMGQAAKAVNQIMAAGINQAVTEALAFGVRAGLDMEQLVDVLASGAAGNWFLEKRGKTMMQGQYQPGFKLALHHKDLNICESMAEAMRMEIPIATRTRKDYESLMAQGYGNEDISALYRLKYANNNQ
ncbi:MAG: NAD(P)-dependent oxidoreductase [Methylococcaceae bacterium]